MSWYDIKLNNTWKALDEKLLYYQVHKRKYLYLSVSEAKKELAQYLGTADDVVVLVPSNDRSRFYLVYNFTFDLDKIRRIYTNKIPAPIIVKT